MGHASLNVLDLLRDQRRVFNRIPDLLKDPRADKEDGWYMAVPPCFNDALDIKYNANKDSKWTQSGCFTFKQGDTLYNTDKAYQKWSDALHQIKVCVQIKNGFPTEMKSGGDTRFPGSVSFDVLVPNNEKTKLLRRGTISMTQDQFVEMLISGPSGEMKELLENNQMGMF